MKPAIISLIRSITGCNTPNLDDFSDQNSQCLNISLFGIGFLDAPDFLPLGGTKTDFFNDGDYAGLTYSVCRKQRGFV